MIGLPWGIHEKLVLFARHAYSLQWSECSILISTKWNRNVEYWMASGGAEWHAQPSQQPYCKEQTFDLALQDICLLYIFPFSGTKQRILSAGEHFVLFQDSEFRVMFCDDDTDTHIKTQSRNNGNINRI